MTQSSSPVALGHLDASDEFMEASFPQLSSSSVVSERPLSTEEFALAINFLPQTIRKRVNQTGSYFGIKPTKLPNGRYRWPSDSPARFFNGGLA